MHDTTDLVELLTIHYTSRIFTVDQYALIDKAENVPIKVAMSKCGSEVQSLTSSTAARKTSQRSRIRKWTRAREHQSYISIAALCIDIENEIFFLSHQRKGKHEKAAGCPKIERRMILMTKAHISLVEDDWPCWKTHF